MKTKIVFYAGFLGIALGEHMVSSTPHNDGTGDISLGISISDIEITQAAYDELFKIPAGTEERGNMTLYIAEGNVPSFGIVLSDRLTAIPLNLIQPTNKWDITLLKQAINPELEPTRDFQYFVNTQLKNTPEVKEVKATEALTTPEQRAKMDELKLQGYELDMEKSTSATGAVFTKGDDIWFMGMNGEIIHNPEGITINT